MQYAGKPMRDTTTAWMQDRDPGTLSCVAIIPCAVGATAALMIFQVATLIQRLTTTALSAAMARHRAVSDGRCWRRSSDRAMGSVQRRPGIEVVDAKTGMAHQVSAEQLRIGRARGYYEALCGVRFLVASMVEPGRGPCSGCAS